MDDQDRYQIIALGQVNILMYSAMAFLSLALGYYYPDYGFPFGLICGASIFAVAFEGKNIKTFLLVSDLIEKLQSISDRESTGN